MYCEMSPEFIERIGVVFGNNSWWRRPTCAHIEPVLLELQTCCILARKIVPFEVWVVSEATSTQMDAEQLIQEEDIVSAANLIIDPLLRKHVVHVRGKIAKVPERAVFAP